MEEDEEALLLKEFESSSEVEETTTVEPTSDPFGDSISTISCKYGIINNLEALLNKVASGWKYHVSNTDNVKDAWFRLDNATSRICGHIGGLNFFMCVADAPGESRLLVKYVNVWMYGVDWIFWIRDFGENVYRKI